MLTSLNRTLLLELEVTLQPSLIETHGLYCKLGKRGEQLYDTLILLPGLKNAFRKAEKSFTADLRASDFLTKDHESTLRDLFEKHYRGLKLTDETIDYFGGLNSINDRLSQLHEHLMTTLATQCLL